jgi:hypothetical protein
VWQGMIQRCYNPNNSGYKNYGGRGIKVCIEWHQFKNFYADMGDRPEKMSLDRIDNDKDYCLENCRWATTKQQSSNKSTNKNYTYNGITLHLADWARKLKIDSTTLSYRIKAKWPLNEIFSEIKRRM